MSTGHLSRIRYSNANRILAITACVSYLLCSSIANSATVVVDTSEDDDSACSLRNAVASINESSSLGGCSSHDNPYGINDTIVFAPTLIGSEIVVQGEPIEVSMAMRIDGQDNDITISGNNETRIFSCNSVNLFELHDISLRNAQDSGDGGAIWASFCPLYMSGVEMMNNISGGDGGAIFATFSSVHVEGSNISSNTSGGAGGAIYSQPARDIQIVNSVISENSSSEGAIRANGNAALLIEHSHISNNDGSAIWTINVDISISNSLIDGNSASWSGGGIHTFSGSSNESVEVDIAESSFLGNSAGHHGGALYTLNRAHIDIRQSTFYGNNAAMSGGAVYIRDASSLNVQNSTFSSNSTQSESFAGGGAIHAVNLLTQVELTHVTMFNNRSNEGGAISIDDVAQVRLSNSIIARSQDGADCISQGGLVVADEFNIIVNDECSTSASNDIPDLAPIGNNGGQTMTHAIRPYSAGWKNGNPQDCLDFDQRGVLRGSQKCDVGSFEETDIILHDSFRERDF